MVTSGDSHHDEIKIVYEVPLYVLFYISKSFFSIIIQIDSGKIQQNHAAMP
jgi:hypothetical protein